MNAHQLSKKTGTLVKLRPIPERRPHDGMSLPQSDDQWRIVRVGTGEVELRNIRTDHIARLGFDNIREFRTPDFLLLRCQLALTPSTVLIEPIIGNPTKIARAHITLNDPLPQFRRSDNVSSITDDGTGRYTLVWKQNFSSSDYDVQLTPSGCRVDLEDVRQRSLTFRVRRFPDLPNNKIGIRIVATEST